jgi:Gamma-glutamyl cyclotransferase, AIG2-like
MSERSFGQTSVNEETTENLFAYGTLRTERVQLSLFGRRLEGKEDELPQYRLTIMRIEDEDFVASSGSADHRNLQFTGNPSDYVEGAAFAVTKSELLKADSYEPAGYTRTLVQLRSGLSAWIYLDNRSATASALAQPLPAGDRR